MLMLMLSIVLATMFGIGIVLLILVGILMASNIIIDIKNTFKE